MNHLQRVIFLIFCGLTGPVQAQLKLVPVVPARPVQAPSSFRTEDTARVDTIRLRLPFFDDFSTADKPWARRSPSPADPDTSRWEHRGGAFVNNSYGVRPPSFNVATLDGIGWDGAPYNFRDPFSQGVADQLTSRFIDLSRNSVIDGIFFSFFWQAQGLGERPDPEDFIRLEFFDRTGNWRTVWQQNGGIGPTEFAYVVLPVNLDDYMHRNFRFRFSVSTRLSGVYDAWHIDYVYLNRGRRAANENRLDIAMSTPPDKLVAGPYTAMPVAQFLAQPANRQVNDTVNARVNNLDSRFNVFSYDVIVREATTNRFLTLLTDTSTIITQNQSQYRIFGATNDPRPNRRLVVPRNLPRMVLETKFRLNTRETDSIAPPINFRNNDTLATTTVLDDYLAYDDGTAEYGLAFSQRFGKLAYRYELAAPANLTHIDILFVPLATNLRGETYNLRVWKTIDVGGSGVRDSVLLVQNTFVQYPDTLNRLTRVRLSRSLPLEGSFYIGVEQLSDRDLTLGFDRNTDTSDRLFYNVTNQWVRNTNPRIRGSVLLRPVFTNQLTANQDPALAPAVRVYPNPTTGQLRLVGPVRQVWVFNLQGGLVAQPVLTPGQLEHSLDLGHLPAGLYLLRYLGPNGQPGTEKVLIAR
jgi:hypothetical protein